MKSKTLTPIKLAYSVREASAATSLGRTTIFNYIASGRLKARKVGGRTLIPTESLIALIESEGSVA